MLTLSANFQNIKFMTIRGAVLELSCIQTDGEKDGRADGAMFLCPPQGCKRAYEEQLH